MIVVSPVLRQTEEELSKIDTTILHNDAELFTYSSFKKFVEKLKSEGIQYLMITPIDELLPE